MGRRGSRVRASLASLASLALMAPTASFAAAASCQMLEIGEMPIIVVGTTPMVEASINGKPVRLIIDTGSESTLLFKASAENLGLVLTPVMGANYYGVGGGSSVWVSKIAELKLNTLVLKDFDVTVAGRAAFGPSVVGLLGAPFLLQTDIEFDFPDGKLRFFRPKNCVGDQVVYWGKAYSVTPIAPSNRQHGIEVTVSLNGQPVRAIMDTGASRSVVTTAGAAKAGVLVSTDGVRKAGRSTGIGADVVQTYVAVFPTFAFGDETIRNASLRIADLFHADTTVPLGSRVPTSAIDAPQMLLGGDFFKSHRVYVSKDQSKVYVSYVGGPVFARTNAAASAPPAPAVPPPEAPPNEAPPPAAAPTQPN